MHSQYQLDAADTLQPSMREVEVLKGSGEMGESMSRGEQGCTPK